MPGFTTIWEFHVLPEARAAFERRYGPDGDWARLFHQGEGYLGTELLHDRDDSTRYLTIDRWKDPDAYRVFRARFAEPYAALDRDCAGLTTQEVALGEYDEAQP